MYWSQDWCLSWNVRQCCSSQELLWWSVGWCQLLPYLPYKICFREFEEATYRIRINIRKEIPYLIAATYLLFVTFSPPFSTLTGNSIKKWAVLQHSNGGGTSYKVSTFCQMRWDLVTRHYVTITLFHRNYRFPVEETQCRNGSMRQAWGWNNQKIGLDVFMKWYGGCALISVSFSFLQKREQGRRRGSMSE